MEMNSKVIRIIVLTGLIVFAFLGLLYFSVSRITPHNNESKPEMVWELLFLDKAAFPQGWSKSEIFEDCISAPLDSGCDNYQAKNMMFYYDEQDRAYEVVRFYDSKEAALNDFLDPNQLWFYVYSNMTKFELPDQLAPASLSADQYKIQCNHYKEVIGNQCRMVAQYGRFIVEFTLSGPTMDYGTMKQAVNAIDKQMNLYRDNPPYRNN